ncbi:flagellar filament capping protein FliD [Solirubrobacter ginsenosidimutans]|uniref:Flagellar hook-associated protein 2 n=2 Tax=Solirubrobacter ginsenosidimutans TaxID=490573 RepID=A0A9X3MSU4_9ACTN|nr:flagellar filament capping protein FliD [Solirubrobacter ginsenosidimutans]
MAGISLTGMASGLDTDSIISQLMALEQNKVVAVQMRQVKVQAHKDDLSAIKTKLDAFKSAAAALSDTATWKATQTTSSADPTKLDVALLGGAGIGGHTLQIDKLASSAQHGFTYTPSATAGSFDLYYGSDPLATGASKVTVSVAANATASDVATAINANENAPVYAAVIKDASNNERIVFSSRKTGQSSDFTVDPAAMGAGSSIVEDGTYSRTGTTLNASFKLDGEAVARTSESNIVDNAIPGVRLTLKGITASPMSVTTTAAAIDTAGVGKKVQALVDAYNAVVTATRAQLTEKNDPKATTTSGLQAGSLFGDSGLTSMLGQMKSQMTQVVTGLGLTSLADIGITIPKSTGAAVTQEAKDGKLTFDSTVLTTALNTDWTKVRDLFTGKGATKGVSSLLTGFVDKQTSTSGVLTGRMASDDTTLKDFTAQITKLNDRMTSTQARLKAQFTAMETALNQSQTQQAWLTSQISSLPSLR